VKEKNPGADLLMAVDWKALLKDQATGLADLPPASEIVGGKMETVTIAPQVHKEALAPPQRAALINKIVEIPGMRISRSMMIGVVVVACLVATAVVILLGRRKQP
jgi:hypothetical protein